MKPSKSSSKVPVWRIFVVIIALISGIYMTIGISLIPSWWLYSVPNDLCFLLTNTARSAAIFIVSMLLLVNNFINSLKGLLTKFFFAIAWINIVRIGSMIFKHSFRISAVELFLLLVFTLILFVVFKVERYKFRKQKSIG